MSSTLRTEGPEKHFSCCCSSCAQVTFAGSWTTEGLWSLGGCRRVPSSAPRHSPFPRMAAPRSGPESAPLPHFAPIGSRGSLGPWGASHRATCGHPRCGSMAVYALASGRRVDWGKRLAWRSVYNPERAEQETSVYLWRSSKSGSFARDCL